jgi:hypothetical protein
MPRYFSNVMKSPYFAADNQKQIMCKCLRCKMENLLKRFFWDQKR